MVDRQRTTTQNKYLREERLRHRWSQKELAARLGTTAVNISRWERGITTPGAYFRFQLSLLFQKEASDLGFEEVRSKRSDHTLSLENAVPRNSSFPGVPTPLWTIPYRRNPLFTGREGILRRLHQILQAERTANQPQALAGLGGIGKTQTVLEYAYRYRDDYLAVFWIRAETLDLLVADCYSIVHQLQLFEKEEFDQWHMLKEVKAWLSKHTQWLLIVDNVEDLALLEHIIPSPNTGSVLLTTRIQAVGTLAQSINLEPMDEDEGTLFVLRRAKCVPCHTSLEEVSIVDSTDARTITQLMGGLPLALDQAGAYTEETGCSLSNYLDCFRYQQATLLTLRGMAKSDHPQSVHATFLFAFEQVKQTDPVAVALLQLCSLLHPNDIPEEIIREGATRLNSPLQLIAVNPLQLNAAFALLRRYSLLQRNPATKMFTIHCLVQVVISENMDSEKQIQWLEYAIKVLDQIFPESEDARLWPYCQRYLPHVQSCALQVERRGIAFAEAAHLFSQAALYLWRSNGSFVQAKDLLNSALSIRIRLSGQEHPHVTELTNMLAMVNESQLNRLVPALGIFFD